MSGESSALALDVTSFSVGPEQRVVDPSNRLPMPDEEARRLERAGAIAPPYPPHWLSAIFEQSTALRPAIEALENNVDGHGHSFKCRFDMKAPDAREKVAEALMYENLQALGGLKAAMRFDPKRIAPSDLDVSIRMAELDVRMRMERIRLEALFSACCPFSDFIRVRKLLRRDLEVTGNAYLGVRRDNSGDVAEFEWLPSCTMRLRPTMAFKSQREPVFVPIDVPIRSTCISFDYVTTYRTFRTFVQFGLVSNVFYKQFGDPRDVSARDGRVMDEAERARYPQETLATEVLHLKLPSPLFEYGVPRWIGAAPVVCGLRASQEVNANHFDNNGIPRLLITIAGGTLKEGSEAKLKDILKAHAAGRDNYGSCVILQATPAANTPGARVQIDVKPLKEAIPNDGLFLEYAAKCRDEILSQWRLPKFITGLLDDVNRSTAQEGLAFVEDQVFQPMRRDFDVDMDTILVAEGVLFWTFASNSAVSRDPATSADIMNKLSTAGGPTINDVRKVMAESQNEPYQPLTEAWADLPMELAKLSFAPAAGTAATTVSTPAPPTLPAGGVENAAPTMVRMMKARPQRRVSTPHELVSYLLHAREQLTRGEVDGFAATYGGPTGEMLVLPMSGDALAELVEFDQ